jgi:5-methyltetrahydropteroyltriglutamate--homocysteine methyltransferase
MQERSVHSKPDLFPAKLLIPGVFSHATDLAEHPELGDDCTNTFAELVAGENVMPSTECSLGRPFDPQITWGNSVAADPQIPSRQSLQSLTI